MNHKRQSLYFCIALISTSLLAPVCMAAEEDSSDKILLGCRFKHRDTDWADGKYKRVHVAGQTNPATGNTGDLRLMNLYTDSTALRQTFSMTWYGYSSSLKKNYWAISPQFQATCTQNQESAHNARTCNNYTYIYLTYDDGYYVISDFGGGSNAWKAPSDSNATGFLTSASFNSTDPLSVRRRFHWSIYGCTNLQGQAKSPAS
jgi:hypothetical protein